MITGGFVISVHLLAGSLAMDVPSDTTKCVKIDQERSPDPRLRPMMILSCDYDEKQLSRRLLSMFVLPENDLSVEAVERTFSFPELTTAYDHPRDATYQVRVKGRDGSWDAIFSFSEGFYPLDAWRRPRFQVGERPKLLNPRVRGEQRFSMTSLSRSRSDESQFCALRMEDIVRFASRNRWHAETVLQQPTDGSWSWTTALRRGRSSAGSDVDQNGCVINFTLGRSADRKAN